MGTLNFSGGASLSGSGSNLVSASGLSFGSATWTDAPPGTIVQVVNYQDVGGYSSGGSLLNSSSTSFADVMSKAITTKVANSNILVQVMCVAYTSSGTLRGKSKLFRDSTEIDGDVYAWYADISTMVVHTINHLDSPSASAGTTITYKLQAATNGVATGFGYQDGGGGAHNSITLFEIVT